MCWTYFKNEILKLSFSDRFTLFNKIKNSCESEVEKYYDQVDEKKEPLMFPYEWTLINIYKILLDSFIEKRELDQLCDALKLARDS